MAEKKNKPNTTTTTASSHYFCCLFGHNDQHGQTKKTLAQAIAEFQARG